LICIGKHNIDLAGPDLRGARARGPHKLQLIRGSHKISTFGSKFTLYWLWGPTTQNPALCIGESKVYS